MISVFFFNIYLTPLDRFIEKYINQYYIKINKINFLFCKKIIKYFPFQSTSFNEPNKSICKHIYNNKFTKIKYVRYTKNFIVAVLGKKTLALKIKESIKQFIENDLLLKINKKKVINVFNNSANFLSYKISCNKKKYFSFSKPKTLEKKIRIVHKIKLRMKINSDRLLKTSADTL